VCRGDEDLRREVESLLGVSGDILELPALDVAANLLAGIESPLLADGSVNPLRFSVGTRLGPYKILALIGKGGMGDVYRARDSRLGRDVAIKVSAERFSEKFERAAQAIAALNHPNICTLYDVGPNYLVAEFVGGETLANRLQRGGMPLEEALTIAGPRRGTPRQPRRLCGEFLRRNSAAPGGSKVTGR